jgi:hypothetical protein
VTQITHQLVLRLTDFLQQEMIDNILDATKADEIKAYRFQESPLDKPIFLSVLGGNPGDLNFLDARIGYTDMNDLGLKIPSGEIGGGHLWWRRGRVRLGCYFVVGGDIDETVAADRAHTVLGRAMYSIERCPVNDLVDEFGERAVMMMVVANTFSEGGGPENQYLWKGMIHWQALTARPI